MIQMRQCRHARDQARRIAGNLVLFPTVHPERAEIFSNAFWSTLQKLVRMMGACGLTLLIRSLSARSRQSSLLFSLTKPFNLHDTPSTFSADPIHTVLSINDLSLVSSSEQQITLVQDDSVGKGHLFNRLVPGSFGLLLVDHGHRGGAVSSRHHQRKVCTTGAGSASSVVSMSTASKDLTCLYSFLTAVIKTPRTVQKMQPFMTSIMSSFVLSFRPEISFTSTKHHRTRSQ